MKKNVLIILSLLVIVVVGFLISTSMYKKQVHEESAANVESSLIQPYNVRTGPGNAKVTVVEFLDPECESCRAMHGIVKRILKEYEGKIQLVIRYMPFHPNSAVAVSYLEAAREQGKYFEALAALFEHQPSWASHSDPQPHLIPQYLEGLGLDMEQLKASASSFKFTQKLEQDKRDGQALQVNSTPTFFVNGKMLDDIGYEPLKKAIDEELAK